MIFLKHPIHLYLLLFTFGTMAMENNIPSLVKLSAENIVQQAITTGLKHGVDSQEYTAIRTKINNTLPVDVYDVLKNISPHLFDNSEQSKKLLIFRKVPYTHDIDNKIVYKFFKNGTYYSIAQSLSNPNALDIYLTDLRKSDNLGLFNKNEIQTRFCTIAIPPRFRMFESPYLVNWNNSSHIFMYTKNRDEILMIDLSKFFERNYHLDIKQSIFSLSDQEIQSNFYFGQRIKELPRYIHINQRNTDSTITTKWFDTVTKKIVDLNILPDEAKNNISTAEYFFSKYIHKSKYFLFKEPFEQSHDEACIIKLADLETDSICNNTLKVPIDTSLIDLAYESEYQPLALGDFDQKACIVIETFDDKTMLYYQNIKDKKYLIRFDFKTKTFNYINEIDSSINFVSNIDDSHILLSSKNNPTVFIYNKLTGEKKSEFKLNNTPTRPIKIHQTTDNFNIMIVMSGNGYLGRKIDIYTIKVNSGELCFKSNINSSDNFFLESTGLFENQDNFFISPKGERFIYHESHHDQLVEFYLNLDNNNDQFIVKVLVYISQLIHYNNTSKAKKLIDQVYDARANISDASFDHLVVLFWKALHRYISMDIFENLYFINK